ncbi:MAG: valine--tRNA ligase [Sodaliphilus pleomorphus]|uniref:valine--tRNA ligase n=1 Tax=Sodaliphilus pleomorphus TaxID=2606626 RepID=UPI0023F08CC9|nr:valine--tRNA ligase [Sodaliphilus pleomorphus]MDD7065283.1 valine--tRNA ligase [Sodaliphilus pleomorphus]MDY2833298.1 valine--tRNA ligase [Sodaliphilus pleomorphus]
MNTLATKYDPKEVEDKWYKYWMDHHLFRSVPDEREPYTIVIPPPNVTGVLHMGHMLNETIQDILIRHARMEGKNALWVPGTDHASIATEAKVVNRLAQQGIKKTDLSRDEFLKHAWDWTHEHGGIILKQLRKLGASCDWDRTAFTMDEVRSRSVIKVFCDLYNKGLIYRGVRMVNWDPKALTALSDEEVVYKDEHSKLYYLKYRVVEQNDVAKKDEGNILHRDDKGYYAVVATTRPETIMGDTAMCINPNDVKNTWLKGKHVIVPLVGREIPVIEDDYVDIDFGTGCLKVTPAHDPNDHMLGDKYNLESIDIFNDNGTLSEAAGLYVGMDRFDVRRQIEKDLASAGLLEKVEAYDNKVGFSERTNVPIEPKLSMQWFLKMSDLTKPALAAVENGDINFVPKKYINTYRHWMTDTKDWCISRQLWWGHRIPAYFLPKGGYVVAETKEEALKLAQAKDPDVTLDGLRQDEDCLDTWFSSWLWPISLFDGICHPDNPEIKYYYPTSDLVTGPDIIFFWVARMIMAGYEYMGDKPFKNVYFTGIVRDKLGRKMSKSLGNSPDPLELIDRYGADGVRMGMMLAAPAGNDILYDDSLCEQGRNFNNKIWNAFRLVKGWQAADIEQPEHSKIAVQWFQNVLDSTLAEVEDLFSKFRLNEALMAVYRLFWEEFSAWYLEIVKPAYQQPVDRATLEATLRFFDILLRLLHPFMPFITEELWQHITERHDGESIMLAQLPKGGKVDRKLLDEMNEAKEIISGVRSVRLSKNVPNKSALKLLVVGKWTNPFKTVVEKLANLESIGETATKDATAASFMVSTTEYEVPLEGNIDVAQELKKLEAELEYQQGFLKSVEKKLSNEKFVAHAPEAVVNNERKKQADALSKIKTLQESIDALKK